MNTEFSNNEPKKTKKNKNWRKLKPKVRAAFHQDAFTSPLFKIALGHHRNGKLKEAENTYRQILQIDPNHFDTLHMLGVLAYEVKQYDTGIEFIRSAMTVNPNFPYCYSNLEAILYEMGQSEDAVNCYKKAIELKPDFAKAYNNLGLILNHSGRFEDAIQCCQQAIVIKTDFGNPKTPCESFRL